MKGRSRSASSASAAHLFAHPLGHDLFRVGLEFHVIGDFLGGPFLWLAKDRAPECVTAIELPSAALSHPEIEILGFEGGLSSISASGVETALLAVRVTILFNLNPPLEMRQENVVHEALCDRARPY